MKAAGLIWITRGTVSTEEMGNSVEPTAGAENAASVEGRYVWPGYGPAVKGVHHG